MIRSLINHAIPRSVRSVQAVGTRLFSAQATTSTLFVANLGWNVDEDDLTEFLQDAGELEHVKLFWKDGRHMGCGVAQFKTVESAYAALTNLHEKPLNGKPVHIREDMKTAPRVNPYTAVRNSTRIEFQRIPAVMTDDELANLCRYSGELVSLRRNRGDARKVLVEMSTSSAAFKVVGA